MPLVAVYTLTITDPETGLPTSRVHVMNPWIKTSLPGVMPETWNLNPPARLAGETETVFLTRLAGLHVPVGVPFRLVEIAALPSRRWRNAWKHNGTGAVAPDLPMARGLRKRELLAERDTRLAKVRAEAAAFDEDGDNGKAKAKKDRAKVLRALDVSIDAQLASVQTIAALDTWKPPELLAVD